MTDYRNRSKYENDMVVNAIIASLELLTDDSCSTTPTKVLDMCQFEASNFSRSVVIDIAYELNYKIHQVSKGYRISRINSTKLV